MKQNAKEECGKQQKRNPTTRQKPRIKFIDVYT